MASRRIRIKGIANIPQRRKTAISQEQPQEGQISKTEDETHNLTPNDSGESSSMRKNGKENFSNIVGEHNHTEIQDMTAAAVDLANNDEHNLTLIKNEKVRNDINSGAVTLPHKKDDANNEEIKFEVNINNLPSKPHPEKTENPQTKPKENDKIESFSGIKGENNALDSAGRVEEQINLTSTILTDATSEKLPTAENRDTTNKPAFKRHFIKPIISSNVLQKRAKIKAENEKPVDLQPEPPVTLEAKKDTTKSVHFMLDEKEKETNTEEHIQTRETNEIPYPPAPLSPSKINRGRIKVAPRLGQRRTSFSASESEDDNRKSNRHRNDSVSSTNTALLVTFENMVAT